MQPRLKTPWKNELPNALGQLSLRSNVERRYPPSNPFFEVANILNRDPNFRTTRPATRRIDYRAERSC